MSKPPVISVILPTIRPHLVLGALSSLVHAAREVPYEVVVVADFPITELGCCAPTKHLHVNWIRRERQGVVDAVNVAMTAAQGEYIFLFNDESVLDPDALEILLAEARRDRRQLLTPRHLPEFRFVYYGIEFAPFPFAHRELLEMLGGLLDPAYRGFYADPDLSMRAHDWEIPIRVVEEAVIRHCNAHDWAHAESVSRYLDLDRALFRKRWDHLGVFIDP